MEIVLEKCPKSRFYLLLCQVKTIFLDYQIHPSPSFPYFAKLILHLSSSWNKTSEIPAALSSSVISTCKYICDFDENAKFSLPNASCQMSSLLEILICEIGENNQIKQILFPISSLCIAQPCMSHSIWKE